jgi:hypothetical protein
MAINPVAMPRTPTFLAPGLTFSKIKKHPTISERDERVLAKIFRNRDIFVGFQSVTKRAIGPPNIAGATIIATASASDSISRV